MAAGAGCQQGWAPGWAGCELLVLGPCRGLGIRAGLRGEALAPLLRLLPRFVSPFLPRVVSI